MDGHKSPSFPRRPLSAEDIAAARARLTADGFSLDISSEDAAIRPFMRLGAMAEVPAEPIKVSIFGGAAAATRNFIQPGVVAGVVGLDADALEVLDALDVHDPFEALDVLGAIGALGAGFSFTGFCHMLASKPCAGKLDKSVGSAGSGFGSRTFPAGFGYKRPAARSYSTSAAGGGGTGEAAAGGGCSRRPPEAAGCGCISPGGRLPEVAGDVELRLLRRIEDVRADALRDHAETSRRLLHLAEELNKAKIKYADAVNQARRQVGITGFQIFLALGAFSAASLIFAPAPAQQPVVVVPSPTASYPPAPPSTTPSSAPSPSCPAAAPAAPSS